MALFQEEGLAVDIEDGLAAGMEQGADNFAALTAKLLADSRTEDLMRATADKEFRDMLYQEYGILTT